METKFKPHPEAEAFACLLGSYKRTLDVRFRASVYRAINPKYSKAKDLISGVGGLYASGRFNQAGQLRLTYTALAVRTALEEKLSSARYFQQPENEALPCVLVGLEFKGRRVLDLRKASIRRKLKISLKTMTGIDWRAENKQRKEALTQAWGRGIANCGFEAVIVPSSAQRGEYNLVIFTKNLLPSSWVVVSTKVPWPSKK